MHIELVLTHPLKERSFCHSGVICYLCNSPAALFLHLVLGREKDAETTRKQEKKREKEEEAVTNGISDILAGKGERTDGRDGGERRHRHQPCRRRPASTTGKGERRMGEADATEVHTQGYAR